MEKVFLKGALFSGQTINALKLGTVLTQGWFWMRKNGCTILYRGDSLHRIDFENIIAIEKIDASKIQVLDFISHENNADYFYAVRKANCCGNIEQTLCLEKVSLNSQGNLASPKPNGIYELKAKQVSDNKIQLTWQYFPLDQKSKPVCFKIYRDDGLIETIKFTGSSFYNFTSRPLEQGIYLFAVKSEDAAGEQSQPAQIKFHVKTLDQETLTILSVEAE